MIEEKKTEGREMSARVHKILREVRRFCEDGNQTEGDGHPECPFALCIADIDRALYLVTTLGQMHDNAAMLATRERLALSDSLVAAFAANAIPVNSPFVIRGVEGGEISCDGPGDASLPIEETANCTCMVGFVKA